MRTGRCYCVYIVGSTTGTLYIGMTCNLQKRAFEHKSHCTEGFHGGFMMLSVFFNCES